MSLPGCMVERLEAALLDAFPDDDVLDQLIRRVGMQARVPSRAALATRVGKLVELVDAQGRVRDLLDAALDLAPGNAFLAQARPAIRSQLEDGRLVVRTRGVRTPEQDFEAASEPTAADIESGTGKRSQTPAMGRELTAPKPAYASAEVEALSKRLEGARTRKQALHNADQTTSEVDREILELRRQLREGGQLRPGDSLGDSRYLLVRQLGRGGFAVVWEAYDREIHSRVAIKVLHQHLANDPLRRERFFRGARVMMEMKHPAVVRVYDPRGEDNNFCYFVMEYVGGGDLREAVVGERVVVASERKVDAPSEILAMQRLSPILQVGSALGEAHARGLVHRDIKPANILLDESGNAKLTDFDLVSALDTTGGTRTGALGTFLYAAPECLQKPQDATARADVFGLGMTAIFCLSGQEITINTLLERANAVAQLNCAASVRKVLERAVALSPERRFADAAEMTQALRDAMDGSLQNAKEMLRDGRQLRAGDTLADDRYLLINPVGCGSFALVWEAWDRAKLQRVAIKMLHQHLAGDPRPRERFFRGARKMMELDHPAAVRIYDPCKRQDGFCYFVMEILPGGNLRDAVLERRVQGYDILPLLLQVGEALAEAHSREIVHGDVKPANILLDADGNARLTDFALVAAQDTSDATRTSAMHTVPYAAPECWQKPEETTAQADVFSLGMTAIFCLSGQDLTIDTLLGTADMMAQMNCTAAVRQVLSRAVELSPDRRFINAAAMVDALRDAINRSSQIAIASQLRSIDGVAVGLRDYRDWAAVSGRDHDGLWAAFEVEGVRYRMRWVPPGRFLMGSPPSEPGRWADEGPQHWVTITKGYWLGETPVTQALWVTLMGENPSRFRSDDRPVEHVSWNDCQKFVDRLNRQIGGLETRLPTEAEWERACRAETTAATWVGDLTLRGAHDAPELDTIAWYGGNSGVDFELDNGHDSSGWVEKQHAHVWAGTHSVGRKAPNPYGLHDMLGNVFEWCQDAADNNHCQPYTSEPAEDPISLGGGSYRAARGGSWRGNASVVRAATRLAFPRVARRDSLGFRLAGRQALLRR